MALGKLQLRKRWFELGGSDVSVHCMQPKAPHHVLSQARTFDPNQPLGNPLIYDVLLAQWFGTNSAEGISDMTSKYFEDLPRPLIALVITAVRHDHWVNVCMFFSRVRHRSKMRLTSG